VKPPKISVVMSVYNGEKHLREAADSILNQTFTDFEFIIINDGSTDKTKKILESFSDPRIRLFHHENIGLTKSLNRGLKNSKGDFIARMDADDISHPDRFYEQVAYLEQNPATGLLGTQYSVIDDNGKEFGTVRNPIKNPEIKDSLLINNTFCHGSVMFRKELLHIVGYYREKFSCVQDYDLWLRFAEHTEVSNLDSVLYKLRRSINSITRKKTSQQLNYHLLTIELAKERIHNNGSDSLEIINMDQVEKELHKQYKVSYSRIKQFKSACYMGYYHESIKLGYVFNSLTFWLKSFFLNPDISKLKFLKNIILKYYSII
jgi:glycosyltransferase involved in cell wall biosynthesis